VERARWKYELNEARVELQLSWVEVGVANPNLYRLA
jgi:hypothetical protein